MGSGTPGGTGSETVECIACHYIGYVTLAALQRTPFVITVASGDDIGGECVTSSLTAHIWKIGCAVGDIIKSAEHVLVVLEAMKTEVSIEAGE